MTDRLERALRATRDQETGASPHAEETLRRILAERLAAKRAWARRARGWIPIAAVLAFATAALARWESLGRERAPVGARDKAPAMVHELRAPGPLIDAPLPPPSFIEPSAASGETPPSMPLAPAAATSSPRARASDLPGVASSPPAVAPADAPQIPLPAAYGNAEAHAYARAHRLHFDTSDPQAALAAWDDYLRHFPAGRFTPDARYNRAIDLLKLRRYGEAREALQPFADGVVGGYHRNDARELLRSIPQ